MAITRSDTPWNLTPAIVAFCQSISTVEQPIYVPVKRWQLAELNWCLDNTKLYMSKHESHGHSMVNGWNIWETPGVWLEAEAHSIIRKKDGTLVDINPHPDRGPRILFLPDSFTSANWERGMVADQYHPLGNDPKLLELVETKRKIAEFRGRFPFVSCLVTAKGIAMAKKHAAKIAFTELSESDDLEYRTLDEKIKSLMAELKLLQIK